MPTHQSPQLVPTVKANRAGLHLSTNRFTASVRVPVVPANRHYLRALRAAEMASWEKTCGTRDPAGVEAKARRKVWSAVDCERRLETAAFVAISLCSALVLVYSLLVGVKCAAAW